MASSPTRRSTLWLTFLLLSLLLADLDALYAQSVDSAQNPTHAATAIPNWQYGVFTAGGFAQNYKISYQFTLSTGQLDAPSASVKLDFWNAGFTGGRMLSALHGPGALRGRVETMLEVTPFWLARYPKQNLVFIDKLQNGTATQPGYGPIDMHGASITPFLIRWNFQRRPDTHILPWAQVGGGLLWTNHKFPYAGDTSVINFTPQVGLGFNTRIRPHQTLDLGLKAILISNAGLGDNDPGVASLQFAAGYSWWK